ncbi:hypothetical protein [Stutzerimonas nitrititolerans]|uniref:hypothetical protein n=1 Tax=Stutzerimonas nitrititolerans TaxID=2482751 RepID=UPI002899EB37|nr:hypothetical protein [Stutzerimonas nitrititolerans]
MILSKILGAISDSLIHLETRESDKEVFLKYRINGLSLDRDRLQESLTMISQRDVFTVSIEHSESDQTTTLTEETSEALDDFCERLSLWNDTAGVAGVITLRVSKSAVNRTITVYSLDDYVKYLGGGSLVDVLGRMSSIAEVAYAFECIDLNQSYKTQKFVFRPYSNSNLPSTNPKPVARAKKISQREKVCSVYGGASEISLPDDFKFDGEFPHAQMLSFFQKLVLVHALIGLSDVTKFDASGAVSLVLKGYKNVKVDIRSLADINVVSENDYYLIFDWVYTDGNIVDKSGIARNLISIHVIDDDLFSLKSGCLESIASNYIIYLKDNLKQYVEIKNKLSDQIQKTSEKASEVVKSINSYLRASIFSVYSFVFSVFIIRSIGKSDSSPMFSDAAYSIFILFLLVSILVFIYALAEANAETRRFKKMYAAFRERYSDLIAKEDLKRIFLDDEDFKRDIAYIRTTRKKVVILWVSSLVVIFGVVSFVKIMNYGVSTNDVAAHAEAPAKIVDGKDERTKAGSK